MECYVHGYLLQRADCLACDASIYKCCHDCLVVAVQFDLTGSGLWCPGGKCMKHCVHFLTVDVLGFMPLWDRGTEELGRCLYATQGFSWSEEISPYPFLSGCVCP